MLYFQTPAKINTVLHILKRRTDGYHELYMHIVPINLFDTIYLEQRKSGGIQLKISGQQIAGNLSDNLILQAAQSFQRAVSFPVHLSLHLLKKIPTGAGLGGGSGNAAGTLQVLNQLYSFPLSPTELHQLGLSLGADIPFFLEPQASLVQGIGEKISPLADYPSLHLVIVKPSLSIPTAIAYRECTPQPIQHRILPPTTVLEVVDLLHNQFEKTVFLHFPILQKIRELLCRSGAVGALMSGSGSAIFGICTNVESQQQIAKQLHQEKLGQVFTCQSISPYFYQYHPS